MLFDSFPADAFHSQAVCIVQNGFFEKKEVKRRAEKKREGIIVKSRSSSFSDAL